MIKRFCDGCGAELIDGNVFRVEVERYDPGGFLTTVARFRETCPTCIEGVIKILREWKQS